jgi:hypothetical protein
MAAMDNRLLTILLFVAASSVAEEFTFSRNEIVDSVYNGLVPSMDMPKSERAAFKDIQPTLRPEVERIASQYFQEKVKGLYEKDTREELAAKVFIRSAKREYLLLRIEQRILQIKGSLKYHEMNPTPDEKTKQAVQDMIKKLVAGIRQSFLKRGEGIFTDEDIEKALSKFSEDANSKISNHNIYSFKVPAKPSEVGKFLTNFDNLLVKERKVIEERLNEADNKKEEKQKIARELINSVVGELNDITGKPELMSIKTRDLVPEYAEVVKRLAELDKKPTDKSEEKKPPEPKVVETKPEPKPEIKTDPQMDTKPIVSPVATTDAHGREISGLSVIGVACIFTAVLLFAFWIFRKSHA